MNQPTQPNVDPSVRELEEIELRMRMERIGHKLLVLSGKGGVGKSTVAANLAVSLATAGHQVGLLDVDLHGPSITNILGLAGQRLAPGKSGGLAPFVTGEGLAVVSIGMLLNGPADAVIWRGPRKYQAIRQLLKDVEWGDLDYLVIDSPPGTGDEPLAVAQLVGPGAWAVVVTTPQDVAIADVRRSISFCRSVDLPVAGIVENMSGLTCPYCGRQIDLFKTGGGEALAAEMNVPFLVRVPLSPAVVTAGDTGRPVLNGDPAAAAFRSLADSVVRRVHPAVSSAASATTAGLGVDGV